MSFARFQSIDEYVHRIGRTGRVGNTGKATSFFDPGQDGALAGDLKKILADAQQEVPDFIAACTGGGSNFTGRGFGGTDVRSFGGGGGGDASNNAGAAGDDDGW